jgi:hypothetical protein
VLLEFFREGDLFFQVFVSIFMGHFDGGVRSVDLHPASLHFCRGYSGPWRANRSSDGEVFVLGSAKIFFDVLVLSM